MKRYFLTPCKEPPISDVYDVCFVPNNRAVEQILDTGDDVLPNTINLLKNPMYATALQDFAKYVQSEPSFDYSKMDENQIFDLIDKDNDLNNQFWKFIDASNNYKNLSKK